MNIKSTKLEKVGLILVLMMTLLQGFYGTFAFIEPSMFSNVRGTELFSTMDADWVNIYGSRTIFIASVLGYLLYTRNFHALLWCTLFGVIMPISDGLLAYQAQAPFSVVLKHILTIVYLVITFFVLRKIVNVKGNSYS